MSNPTLAIDVDDALIQEPRDGVFQDPPADVPPAPHPVVEKDDSSAQANLSGTSTENQEEHIRNRAYELWQQRGCPSGSPEEDWFQAQSELMAGQG